MSNISCEGDKHDCPKHGPNVIVSGSSQMLDGKPMATVGSACACGGTIVSGSGMLMIDGKPVATVGSATSCGGIITSGSSNGKA